MATGQDTPWKVDQVAPLGLPSKTGLMPPAPYSANCAAYGGLLIVLAHHQAGGLKPCGLAQDSATGTMSGYLVVPPPVR